MNRPAGGKYYANVSYRDERPNLVIETDSQDAANEAAHVLSVLPGVGIVMVSGSYSDGTDSRWFFTWISGKCVRNDGATGFRKEDKYRIFDAS